MKKTEWYPKGSFPVEPGVYQTRYDERSPIVWWRAWDGQNWRSGRIAVQEGYPNLLPAPSLEHELRTQVAIMAFCPKFEWRGTAR